MNMVSGMKKVLFSFLSGLAVLIFSGCGHTPVRKNSLMALPPLKTDAKVAAQRAENFKKIIRGTAIRGIVVYPASFIGRMENKTVLDTITVYGFNRIYCHLTSEQELNKDLLDFITLAAERKLPVELVFSQQDFYRRYRGNRLIRNFFVQYPDLYEAVLETVEFSRDLPENVKISGITVVLTPHLFNSNNTQRIQGQLYSWDEKNYGIGQDNDILMQQSLQYARKIAAIPGLPELTIAIPDFFHEAAMEKKLSCGTAADFSAIASRLAVINSANLPSRIPAAIDNELRSMPSGKKLLAVVKLAGHTSLNEGVLRRRNWRDFQNSINYVIKKLSPLPGFGGIIVSPLAVVEYLRQEK